MLMSMHQQGMMGPPPPRGQPPKPSMMPPPHHHQDFQAQLGARLSPTALQMQDQHYSPSPMMQPPQPSFAMQDRGFPMQDLSPMQGFGSSNHMPRQAPPQPQWQQPPPQHHRPPPQHHQPPRLQHQAPHTMQRRGGKGGKGGGAWPGQQGAGGCKGGGGGGGGNRGRQGPGGFGAAGGGAAPSAPVPRAPNQAKTWESSGYNELHSLVENIEARGGNYKSSLNELVMKLSGHPLTTGDVVYTVKSSPPKWFKAVVKVMAIDRTRDFEGDSKARKRDAEQSAAQQALAYYLGKLRGDSDTSTAQPISLGEKTGLGDGLLPACEQDLTQNFKSVLNEIVTKVLRRPMTAQDVVYTTEPRQDGLFVSSVKVLAIEGQCSFSGGAKTRKKDAEQSAAEKAAQHFQSLPWSSPPKPAIQADAGKVGGIGGLEGSQPNYKSLLNELVMRATARPLVKGDVIYNSVGVTGGGFLSTVEVPALGAGITLEGETKTTKKESEQTSAKAALERFEPTLTLAMEQVNAKARARPTVPRAPGPISGGQDSKLPEAQLGLPAIGATGQPVVVGVPAPKLTAGPFDMPATKLMAAPAPGITDTF